MIELFWFKKIDQVPKQYIPQLRNMCYRYGDHMCEIFRNKDTKVKDVLIVVNTETGKVVAWASRFKLYHYNPNTEWGFWVRSSERKKGYGHMLIEHVFLHGIKAEIFPDTFPRSILWKYGKIVEKWTEHRDRS